MDGDDQYANGFLMGVLVASTVYVVVEALADYCHQSNYSSTSRRSSMVIGASIIQSDGTVVINAVDVTGRDYTSPPISRAFRITADGQTLPTQLSPDSPIILRVAPDTRIGELSVGGSLRVEEGGVHVTGDMEVNGSMTLRGPVHAETIHVDGSLTCTGDMAANGKVKVDGSVHVTGNATWLDVSAGGSTHVGGERRRRASVGVRQ
jgi:hypothetical protein